MILKKLKLLNFRNYNTLSLNLSDRVNIFIGNNGQGKTNILESIYILALTKTFRVGVEKNLIKFEKENTKIQGTSKNNKIIRDLEINIDKDSKKLIVNKTVINKVIDYISNLNVILFTPDDLEIIKDAPAIRRKILNIQLSQISIIYLKKINEYNKCLKLRNEYLKTLYNKRVDKDQYLDVLTQKLIECACVIYKEREEYISKINEQIGDIYKNITNFEGLWIKYTPNINIQEFCDEKIEEILTAKFCDNLIKEIEKGTTLFGPHLDDFSFLIDKRELKLFGSQGQQKLAVIAYKLAEIPIFYKKTGTNPILLFDDIFSEIDKSKKNKLLKYIDQDIQIVITTTDLKDINRKIVEKAFVFNVNNGTVEKREGK